MPAEDGLYLLSASVCPLESRHYFRVMYGTFEDGKFEVKYSSEVDRGPDQYAGQVFHDHLGRNLLITWMPGWKYKGYYDYDIGCFTVPREIKVEDGRMTAYPIEELQYLLKDEDPCLVRTEKGFTVERANRDPLVYEGEIKDLKILRDEYVAEIFVNGGEEVYTVLL
jgi:sucrose-6-phosphate hydrolase SacC (GH32 family)